MIGYTSLVSPEVSESEGLLDAGWTGYRTTKRLVIDAMAAGLPWDVARQHAKAPISRATAFRRQARFRTAGDAVFREQRHGHAWRRSVRRCASASPGCRMGRP